MSNWDNVSICESRLAWLAMDRGEWAEAADRLTLALGTIEAQRLHDYVFSLPAFAVAARLFLHHSDGKEARRQLARAMRARPSLGALIDEVNDFRDVHASRAAPRATGAVPLTPAELRLLPYLQTHLTAEQIAERLFLSSHTVKTEVKVIYRKLGVSSRNDAVQRATAISLLGG